MGFSKIVLDFVRSGRTVKCLRTLNRSESPVSIFHSIPQEIPFSPNIQIAENSWWNTIKNYLRTFKDKYTKKIPLKTQVESTNYDKEEAIQLNKIAIRQAKKGYVERTYPKATQEDLKRLTSETIEDSYTRVEYISPKDGRVYNILKQGETEDGKIIVRILDEEGAFVKEAKITPKKIAILDDFGIDRYEHGEQVLTYAKRHNPFAIYTKLEHSDLPKKINDLIKTLENNQYDYINFSSGKPIRINDVVNMLKQLSPKELAKIGLNKKMQKNLNLDKRKIEELRDFYIKALREYPELSKSNAENELILYLDDLCTKNTRVLVASGNHLGFGFLNNKYLYIGKNLEGVGSLSSEGRISHFSSSRNKGYTKHYEVSESQLRETPYGYNFTGKAGTDSTKSELPYCYEGEKFEGTSFATPIRTAKLALNDMMEGIL